MVGAGIKAIKAGTKLSKNTPDPVTSKPSSEKIQSFGSFNKGKETPTAANDAAAPKPKASEVDLPKSTAPKGDKKSANDDNAPEVKGTGTTGPAPKPKLKEPEQIKEPKTFELPKVDMPKPGSGANVNTPSTTTKPDIKPYEMPKVDMPKPGSGANVNAPAAKPSASPAAKPAPAASPAPAAKPSASPAAKPAAKPAPKTKSKPTSLKPRLPFKLPSLGGNFTTTPHSEYHSVPVSISVGQARAHRTFKEETGPDNTRRKDSSKELVGRPDSAGVKDSKSVLARNASIKTKIIDEEKKLAGVIKSVIKKKKEEKESGPNPLVDFEPKSSIHIRSIINYSTSITYTSTSPMYNSYFLTITILISLNYSINSNIKKGV
jgi:hypothetical protein